MSCRYRRQLTAITILVLLGFFVRASSLDAQSLWRDEVDALRFATAPWSEMVDNFTRPGWNGPLYYLLLRGWIAAAGTTEYAMRFFSLLLGVLCVPLMYALGRSLFTPSVGLVSAALVTASPYLSWYSQEVKMYALVLALAILAIYSLRRALDRGDGKWWLIQIVATSVAFYSHILAALLVPVEILLALAWWPQTRKRWQPALISLACLTMPYLPLAIWQAPLALRARETGFFPYSLRQMATVLLNGWSTGIYGWGSSWAAALTGLLAGLGVVSVALPPSPSREAEEATANPASVRSGLALLAWVLVPLLCVWLVSLRQPLFTDRYLIWSAPAFYLLVALTLTSFAMTRQWVRWAAVPLMIVILFTNVVNLRQQATIPIKSDFRAAAAYVASHGSTGFDDSVRSDEQVNHTVTLPAAAAGSASVEELIIFQIPHGRHTFDYYFPYDGYQHADGLYTNHRTASGAYLMSEEEAARQMKAVTRGHGAAWLVATEVPMWDNRNLVQRWLDKHAQRTAEAHFNRVDVYRYRLPDG